MPFPFRQTAAQKHMGTLWLGTQMDKPTVCAEKKSLQRVTASLPLGTYPARLYQKSTNRYQLATQQLQLSFSMVETQDSSKVLSSSLGMSP